MALVISGGAQSRALDIGSALLQVQCSFPPLYNCDAGTHRVPFLQLGVCEGVLFQPFHGSPDLHEVSVHSVRVGSWERDLSSSLFG